MDDRRSVLYQQPQAKGDVRDHNIFWFLNGKRDYLKTGLLSCIVYIVSFKSCFKDFFVHIYMVLLEIKYNFSDSSIRQLTIETYLLDP